MFGVTLDVILKAKLFFLFLNLVFYFLFVFDIFDAVYSNMNIGGSLAKSAQSF